MARFTQEDVYRGDGLNLYAYCHNNPVIYEDPSGYNYCTTGYQALKDKLDAGETLSANELAALNEYTRQQLIHSRDTSETREQTQARNEQVRQDYNRLKAAYPNLTPQQLAKLAMALNDYNGTRSDPRIIDRYTTAALASGENPIAHQGANGLYYMDGHSGALVSPDVVVPSSNPKGAYGRFGELLVRYQLEQQYGTGALSGKTSGNHGYDLIFRTGDGQYTTVEVKYQAQGGPPQFNILDGETTAGTVQMSSKWAELKNAELHEMGGFQGALGDALHENNYRMAAVVDSDFTITYFDQGQVDVITSEIYKNWLENQ